MDIDLSGYSHEQDSHVDEPISVPSIAAPCTTMGTVESLSVEDETSFTSWSSAFYDDFSFTETTLAESQDDPSLSYSAITSPGDFDYLASMSSVTLGTSPPGVFADSDMYPVRYIGDDSMKNGYMGLTSHQTTSFLQYQHLETSCSISPTPMAVFTSAELLPSPLSPVWQGDSPMMMQVNSSPNMLPPPPESFEMSYDSTLSGGDHLPGSHSGYISSNKQLQDSQSWPGFNSESQWQGASHSYSSAGSVACGMSRHSSKHARRRHYSSSDVLYPPTSSIHSRRHSASSSGSPGTTRKTYVCPHKECATAFSRQADLDRHNDHIHTEDGKKKKYTCDYYSCSRASTPFYRKDHFRDHLRDQHKEDIVKRGSNANQTVRHDVSGDRTSSSRSGSSISVRAAIKLELGNDSDDTSRTQTQHRELEECSTEDDWWRCSRCLDRVDIQKNGWACPHCKGRIESARFNLRADRHGYQEARTHLTHRVKEEDEVDLV